MSIHLLMLEDGREFRSDVMNNLQKNLIYTVVLYKYSMEFNSHILLKILFKCTQTPLLILLLFTVRGLLDVQYLISHALLQLLSLTHYSAHI